ncbi:adenylate/guanylate cyclase domain-containing protein [Phyllobacterium myrsinacearum]|uniref:Class 3 adenylate cyclase n=1 Tax=Phyllobacterium myrsinacearum TaxID=28101 RepID=A0A839ELK8_9HYPH|nr:adenylate/guanylate cyclase domain-containing protein [Phyllobacterium myrsinacearum]MBA8879752.1 class 3 adenylate cyclase [Phyllobacterium myrsinacearum]
MSETRRKLTTIFSADVQDYTRLMQVDEEATLVTLKQYRDAMTRLIEAHDGRVINTWGDGLIAEFSSVVEAVRAAVDIQNELAGHNAKRPDGTRMLFRIGINLGDVITEGDDIYGDGVNVAARLQTSAAAGGIVISSTVYEQVRNKMTVGFEYLGQLPLKNIEGGVTSYAVRIGADAASPAQGIPLKQAHSSGLHPGNTQPDTSTTSGPSHRRNFGVLGAVAGGIAAINAASWSGTFWAAWPILAIAVIAALRWIRTTTRVDRVIATLTLVGLVVVSINILTWDGTIWAQWPMIGLAVAGGIRWFTRQQHIARG